MMEYISTLKEKVCFFYDFSSYALDRSQNKWPLRKYVALIYIPNAHYIAQFPLPFARSFRQTVYAVLW